MVNSPDDLMECISNMNRANSVYQFYIPGKGSFTLVLQSEEERTIQEDVDANPELATMIAQSELDLKEGRSMNTTQLLQSISPKDFRP